MFKKNSRKLSDIFGDGGRPGNELKEGTWATVQQVFPMGKATRRLARYLFCVLIARKKRTNQKWKFHNFERARRTPEFPVF